MPKGINRLPNELIIDIINKLATPIHELAYLHPPLVLATLLNLALVSHAVSTWSTPFIYNRIVITAPKQLQILHRSICHRPAAEQRPSVEAFAIVRSHDGSDYNLNTEIAQHIHDLLDTMSSTLQRLTIDLPFHGLDRDDPYQELNIRKPIREALLRLPHIVEFINIRDTLPTSGWNLIWPSWTSLRRLALYEPFIPTQFHHPPKALTYLRLLVLAHGHDGNLSDITRHSFNLKVISLVDPNLLALGNVSPVSEGRRDIRFGLYTPENGYHDDATEATQSWFRDQTLRGIFWGGKDSWNKAFWKHLDEVSASFNS